MSQNGFIHSIRHCSRYPSFDDSGLQVIEDNVARIGVAIGSGIGGLDLIEAGHTTSDKSRMVPIFRSFNHR